MSVLRIFDLMVMCVCLLSAAIQAVAGVASIKGQVTKRPGRFVGMLVADVWSMVNSLTPAFVVLLQTIF